METLKQPTLACPSTERIQTFLRIRPNPSTQTTSKPSTCITMQNASSPPSITVHANTQDHKFTEFAHIFTGDHSAARIQSTVASPLVEEFLSGKNCTLLVYGQTGSGKTFTMFGDLNANKNKKNTESSISHGGLLFQTMQEIFHSLENEASSKNPVSLSIIEIYNDRIRDVLQFVETSQSAESIKAFADQNLQLYTKKSDTKSDSSKTHIRGLTEVSISDCPQAMKILQKAQTARSTASTLVNDQSSRGHCIVRVTLKRTDPNRCIEQNSTFYFVDLAGSERYDRDQSQSSILSETKNINKSLSCLTAVIIALCERAKGKSREKQCIPYRNSKLTRLLKESLGGNAKTSIVLCCRDHPDNAYETLSTLRFGAMTRNVVNRVAKNEIMTIDQSMAKIKQLEETIAVLREKRNEIVNYCQVEQCANTEIEPKEISPHFHTPERQIFTRLSVESGCTPIGTAPFILSKRSSPASEDNSRWSDSPTAYRVDVDDRYFPSPDLPRRLSDTDHHDGCENAMPLVRVETCVFRVCVHGDVLFIAFIRNGDILSYCAHITGKGVSAGVSMWSSITRKTARIAVEMNKSQIWVLTEDSQEFTACIPTIVQSELARMRKAQKVCIHCCRLPIYSTIIRVHRIVITQYCNVIRWFICLPFCACRKLIQVTSKLFLSQRSLDENIKS